MSTPGSGASRGAGDPDARRDPPAREAVGDPAEEPDFGDEHDSTTVADGLRHGPEGAPEPESPEGLGGMDQ